MQAFDIFLHTWNSQEGSGTKMCPFPRKNCSWCHVLDFGHPELVTLTNDAEWLIWANYTTIPQPKLFRAFLRGIHLHNHLGWHPLCPNMFSVLTKSLNARKDLESPYDWRSFVHSKKFFLQWFHPSFTIEWEDMIFLCWCCRSTFDVLHPLL